MWLLDKIKKDYVTLSKRVKQQVQEQKEAERREMEAKRKRVEALRKERELEEARKAEKSNEKEQDGKHATEQPAQESVKEKPTASQTRIPIPEDSIISAETIQKLNEEAPTFDQQSGTELTQLNTPRETSNS